MSTAVDPGSYTRTEIYTQPEAWQGVLHQLNSQTADLHTFLADGNFDQVVFTGCGSTYYLSVAAAAATQRVAGLRSVGLPASEIWRNFNALPPARRPLLVAVSRSGETTETLRACTRFRQLTGGPIVTLCCYPDSSLSQLGEINLAFPSIQERSIAQTRAFSGLYLAALALAGSFHLSNPLWPNLLQLPALLQQLFDLHTGHLEQLGRDLSIDRFYFLGSGLRYGLACELSLKMKEMTLSHSEPFYAMEFRHGPKSMITPSTLVVALITEERKEDDHAVVAEMKALGARTLTLGDKACEIDFKLDLDEVTRSVLYPPFGQIVALNRSLAKGLNPDQPENLDPVVLLP
jgi:glucosamine--fructose-6-phosphate aminotransferase (isomerizing)